MINVSCLYFPLRKNNRLFSYFSRTSTRGVSHNPRLIRLFKLLQLIGYAFCREPMTDKDALHLCNSTCSPSPALLYKTMSGVQTWINKMRLIFFRSKPTFDRVHPSSGLPLYQIDSPVLQSTRWVLFLYLVPGKPCLNNIVIICSKLIRIK